MNATLCRMLDAGTYLCRCKCLPQRYPSLIKLSMDRWQAQKEERKKKKEKRKGREPVHQLLSRDLGTMYQVRSSKDLIHHSRSHFARSYSTSQYLPLITHSLKLQTPPTPLSAQYQHQILHLTSILSLSIENFLHVLCTQAPTRFRFGCNPGVEFSSRAHLQRLGYTPLYSCPEFPFHGRPRAFDCTRPLQP